MLNESKIEIRCAYLSVDTEMWFVKDGQDKNLKMINLIYF